MSPEDYWRRIERIPLKPERPSTDGDSMICRAQDGTPVTVTKPEYLKDDEHESVLSFYESYYSPRLDS